MSKMTISVVKGRGSMSHNNREFITENIDKERIKENIYYKQEPLREAYDKLFGAEIERYNSTQKRSDRKINDYMEHIKKSKNGEKLFYETVIQVGNKFDCHTTSEQGKTAKKILNEYMQGFEERNPNLYVFNAVLHLDEATPHLHIDYIPIAENYKTGLQIRNSLDKALKQQGIEGVSSKKNNATQNWQSREKEHIETIMNRYGIEREAEKGIKREHLSIDSYKAVAEQISNEIKTISTEIESKPSMMSKDKVIVDKGDLERLETRAKLSTIHEEATRTVQVKSEQAYKEQQQYISNKENETIRLNRDANKTFDEAMNIKAEWKEKLQEQQDLQSDFDTIENEYYEVLNDKLHFEQMYNHILNDYTELKNNIDREVERVTTPLNAEISDLRTENNKLKEIIQNLKERLQGAFESLTNIVKAVGLLKYGKESTSKYKADNLSREQERLIDGVADYGSIKANNEGFTDLAEDMQKRVALSKDLEKFVEAKKENIKAR